MPTTESQEWEYTTPSGLTLRLEILTKDIGCDGADKNWGEEMYYCAYVHLPKGMSVDNLDLTLVNAKVKSVAPWGLTYRHKGKVGLDTWKSKSEHNSYILVSEAIKAVADSIAEQVPIMQILGYEICEQEGK